MKNKCFCGCGLRRNPKRRYAPGHNQFHRAVVERNTKIHHAHTNSGRKPPQIKLYEGRVPLRIRDSGETNEQF